MVNYGRKKFYIIGFILYMWMWPRFRSRFFIYLFVHFLTRQILLQKNIQTKIRFVPFDPGNLHNKTFDNCNGTARFKNCKQRGSVNHQMTVPVPSIRCCVLNHHDLFCQIQNALAFNWDRCCHLALCLQLLPFNCLNRSIYSYLETYGAVFTTLYFLRNLRIGPIEYSITLQ